MRKKTFFKKSAAVAFAVAMVITAAPNANAAAPVESGSVEVTGDSYMEGVMPSDVVDVVLPTTNDTTYKFILDPAKLLSQYDPQKSKYDSSTVFFTTPNAAGNFSNTSPTATAINKSTCDVILSVDVSVTNVASNPVTFASKDTLAVLEANKDRNLYLALIPANLDSVTGNAAPAAGAGIGELELAQAKAVSNGAVSASFVLEGKESNFEVKQESDTTVTSGHKYVWQAKDNATWTTAGFALAGACNTKADWSAFNTASQDKTNGENLQVKVVYSMAAPTDAQKEELETKTADGDTGLVDITSGADPKGFAQESYTFTRGTALEIPIDLGSGSKAITITSSEFEIQLGGRWYNFYTLGTGATLTSDNKLRIPGDMDISGPSYSIRLKLNDASDYYTATLNVN